MYVHTDAHTRRERERSHQALAYRGQASVFEGVPPGLVDAVALALGSRVPGALAVVENEGQGEGGGVGE